MSLNTLGNVVMMGLKIAGILVGDIMTRLSVMKPRSVGECYHVRLECPRHVVGVLLLLAWLTIEHWWVPS